ncbi:GNAT family N-acetyltransferase [Exiguobacterium antarcticum]|uniref:GNAT family N-acetyltransferase n=1 Tax=Exiguobacterium antarcticum TaxID=132920 RepID=UPI000285E7B0|nr:GNAT family N-acetyltransferase [Exiguobacterium antarcticum]AFS69477.1 Acetyltransferase (GNAT) family protein [Exiguobacterium antarcticum B7]
MIHIKRAPDTETAFLVMKEGFSDYMIPLGLSLEVFQERILKRDGNQLEHSFIAYHGERPVAIWLNGLKTIKKKTVMRCGGLGVDPQYRRLGIAKALYEAQLSYAKSLNVDCLMLEVIQGNEVFSPNFDKKAMMCGSPTGERHTSRLFVRSIN